MESLTTKEIQLLQRAVRMLGARAVINSPSTTFYVSKPHMQYQLMFTYSGYILHRHRFNPEATLEDILSFLPPFEKHYVFEEERFFPPDFKEKHTVPHEYWIRKFNPSDLTLSTQHIRPIHEYFRRLEIDSFEAYPDRKKHILASAKTEEREVGAYKCTPVRTTKKVQGLVRPNKTHFVQTELLRKTLSLYQDDLRVCTVEELKAVGLVGKDRATILMPVTTIKTEKEM
jgi:hypothetical protein